MSFSVTRLPRDIKHDVTGPLSCVCKSSRCNKHPTPSPTPPSSSGVNSQAGANNLNPGDTFCLPIQQVAGIQGGKVEGGGSSDKYPGEPPIDTRWTAYNGPTASSLQVVNTVTYSFVVMADTVPIGSFYQVCVTNITSGVVTFNIQQ